MNKKLDAKLTFLVSSSSSERIKAYSNFINELINSPTIYNSNDGIDTTFKVDNVPPNILVIDHKLAKLSGLEVTQKLLQNKRYQKLAIIIISDLPEDEQFIDELVTGQLQFLTNPSDKNKFHICLRKALNFIATGEESGYRLRYLNPEEVLFNEGDAGDSVYIVKKGELVAFNETKELGKITTGEFVGEMAHFNGEPRSATVRSISHAELIQIPFGSLDVILFSKPAWSKALVRTLTKRLKSTIPTKEN
ncbi:MAG: cyclic nucleotide-binding domain-containing protein [Bdellovibrionales bacterium]|nr:cyclic nucleotide-binding domain-containing protein [Bdellovibrionales bacterium]